MHLKHLEAQFLTDSVLATYFNRIATALCAMTSRAALPTVVVGCSGGIDSALTLALAAKILGPQSVHAISMPSQYTSPQSVSDAMELCANLGVPLSTIPIDALVALMGDAFQAGTGAAVTGIALENLQSRIRGTLLMAYANQHNALLLTTGNKTEILLGYCTLFGDTNGGLNLIGELYKTEVYALSRYLNQESSSPCIPLSILTKAPSAELAPNQQDSNSLPPYPQLDATLMQLQEPSHIAQEEATEALSLFRKAEQLYASQVLSHLLSDVQQNQLTHWARSVMEKNAFKRLQMAPSVAVRHGSFLTKS